MNGGQYGHIHYSKLPLCYFCGVESARRITLDIILSFYFFLIFGAAGTVLLFLQPDARSILTVDFSVIAAWVALISILYIVALIGVFKRQRWGAVVAGITGVLDVIAGFFVFAEVSTQVAYPSELAITVFAFLEYPRSSAALPRPCGAR